MVNLKFDPNALTTRQQGRVNYLQNQGRDRAAKKLINRATTQFQQTGEAQPLQRDGKRGMGRDLRAPKVNFTKPQSILQGQQQANLQNVEMQKEANRFDQETPVGSQRYETDPATGKTVLKTDFGGQEELLKQRQELDKSALGVAGTALDQFGQNISQPVDFSGATKLPGGGDMLAARQQTADATYQSLMRDIEPAQRQEREEFEQRAYQRGWTPGSEAYEREKNALAARQNDARLDAQAKAYELGSVEQSRIMDQALAGRQQDVGEILTKRGLPMQEYSGLLGTYGGILSPQFYGPMGINVPGLDVTGFGGNYLGGLQSLEGQRMSTGQSAANTATQAALEKQKLAQQQAQWEQERRDKLAMVPFAASGLQPGGHTLNY